MYGDPNDERRAIQVKARRAAGLRACPGPVHAGETCVNINGKAHAPAGVDEVRPPPPPPAPNARGEAWDVRLPRAQHEEDPSFLRFRFQFQFQL
jgi:hypothetical protein